MKHLTVRLAWHDNKWDGKTCKAPKRNVYCIAPYSLLSNRLQRERDLEFEEPGGQPLDKDYPKYVPPCFWSSNAFSPTEAKVTHIHAFPQYRDRKRIPDVVSPYSVFTWPFRLSFLHSRESKNANGNYPPDLDSRLEEFRQQFVGGRSIVFFYLNYNNPVSADEYRYALVGCSRLLEIGQTKDYQFSEKELAEVRSGEGMQNMPIMNWALPVRHDGPQAVILPYHEYLERIRTNPDDEQKLREMRVLVEEDELIRCFKYVCEPVDDDRALYLLYKLRKAFQIIDGHGIVQSTGSARQVLDGFIKEVWEQRGLFPGLPAVVALLAEVATGSGPDGQIVAKANDLYRAIRAAGGTPSALERVFALISSSGPIPADLISFSKLIKSARRGFKDNSASEPLLRKLSLFNLSAFQMRRIVFRGSMEKEPPVFPMADISEDALARNPYLLCERYTPVMDNEKWRERELDVPERREGPISPFVIDIGLFPDPEYVESDEDVFDLTPASPERLRALIIEHLHQVGSQGHCFSSQDQVLEFLRQEPLFYRRLQQNKLTITRNQLVSVAHREHYQGRLHLTDKDGETYFYLREVRQAEEMVERLVTYLSKRRDHKIDLSWIEQHLAVEVQELQDRPNFDQKQFVEERRALIEGALKRSLFVISGKAGSGKTHALRKVIERLEGEGERVLLLAPTGKAALRARQEAQFEDAQTVDRCLYQARLGACLQELECILSPPAAQVEPVENLIVDECSMMDLQRMAVLAQLLEQQGRTSLKRVILIGDENQLPPIGLGRPFCDLISYLQADSTQRDKHLVRLKTDCRQQSDPLITEIAEIFIGKNRYYAPLLAKLGEDRELSPWLKVFYWDTPEQLASIVDQQLEQLLQDAEKLAKGQTKREALNLLFGLYDRGYVPNDDLKALTVDAFQIVTPYRAGGYGTLSLNETVRGIYKTGWWPDRYYPRSIFGHSDRIIRNWNWYRGWGPDRELVLSNGSIGFVCNNKLGRRYFFTDAARPLKYIDDEEFFELAYAITVHKAQGSEFGRVFVVVPEQRSLLTRELVYTALTRSKGPVTLFVERTERENPLEIARGRSDVLLRNTSLLTEPADATKMFQPEAGVWVESKIEYIIYSLLKEYREQGKVQRFTYECRLSLAGIPVPIKPDFTVEIGESTFYWEHLGMLDVGRYFNDWQARRKAYFDNGLRDQLVTSDDLLGVEEGRLRRLLDDLVNGQPQGIADQRFSAHHYQLKE
jgi:ATP-dependent exoDNAse (exonuclease V) alpha subunit